MLLDETELTDDRRSDVMQYNERVMRVSPTTIVTYLNRFSGF